MFQVQQTQGTVLCCLCGVAIAPNPTNMCVTCLRSQVDITEGIQKNLTILRCQQCQKFLQPPRSWIKADLESKELLTYCIKRMKNLSKVKLTDASFIWTEPHSKRIKLKVTIQKEVFNGAIVQQAFVAEFVVDDHMCERCTRESANPDQWIAVVQVRQKVDHKRTFFFLEQLILKHGAHEQSINIRQKHDGVDFFFAHRSHALKFVDFLNAVVPIQFRNDKQLVSHDTHTQNYNYKFTFSVEISPICREDLICLPGKAAQAMGNIGPLVLCLRVSNSLTLLDFKDLRVVYLDATQYWRYSFKRLMSSRQLIEYTVLDIEYVDEKSYGNHSQGSHQIEWGNPKGGSKIRSFRLADAQVARVSDLGKNDLVFTTRTHLGNVLRPGDNALGYDLYGANLNDEEFENLEKSKRGAYIPEVILVKKSYEDARKKRRGRARPWKLKSLEMEVEEVSGSVEKEMHDREKFYEELEEDPEMRSRISIFKDSQLNTPAGIASSAPTVPRTSGGAAAVLGVGGDERMVESGGEEEEEEEDDELPEIPLEELLSDLKIEEEEMEDPNDQQPQGMET